MNVILGAPMIMGLVCFLLFLFVFTQRTPYYLISMGKVKEAVKSLKTTYTPKYVR